MSGPPSAPRLDELFACPGCGAGFDPHARCPGCGSEVPRTVAGVPDFLARAERSAPARAVEAFYVEAFYDVRPFPGYAPGDDAGSVLDRSRRSAFLDALDRAVPAGASVLDAGCGTGQLVAFLALAAAGRRVVGIDGCKASLAEAQRFRERAGIANLALARGDLFDLPLREGAFDVVISRGVVHHTEDPYGALRRVAALTRPGGTFVVGFYETFGRAFHCTRRWLAGLAGRPIALLDPILRARDLDAEKKRTWIADQYHHPLEHILPAPRVVRELESSGFSFLRTVPPATSNADLFAAEARAPSGLLGRRLGWALAGVGDPDAGLVCVVARRRGVS